VGVNLWMEEGRKRKGTANTSRFFFPATGKRNDAFLLLNSAVGDSVPEKGKKAFFLFQRKKERDGREEYLPPRNRLKP